MSSSEEQKEEEREQQQQSAVPEQRQADNWNKDVGETGRWGSRTKREILVVAGCIVLMIAATAIGVALGVILKRKPVQMGETKINPETGLRESAYTLPLPPVLTTISDDDELILLKQALAADPTMSKFASEIPETVTELVGKVQDESLSPYERAASWLVTVDKFNAKEASVERFALASMFYALKGLGWTNQTNWMLSDKHHCTWKGIDCCDVLPVATHCAKKSITSTGDGRNKNPWYDLIQIDLYKNNLIGSIPESLALFKDLASLFMNENELTGSLPSNVFSEMPRLNGLYLQHNKLTGSIPTDLAANGVLYTFQIYANDLNGTFPTSFCTDFGGTVKRIGIDCHKVFCDCCLTPLHCFAFDNVNATTGKRDGPLFGYRQSATN